MGIRKMLFCCSLAIFLSACNQQSNETPANPKVNSELNHSADIKGVIIKVDEDKNRLLIKGSGFGLNEDGEGIIQLDTEYYSILNFAEEQNVEIWVNSQTQLTKEHDLPIISDVAKIVFFPKIEE